MDTNRHEEAADVSVLSLFLARQEGIISVQRDSAIRNPQSAFLFGASFCSSSALLWAAQERTR
jgi:hypothetical protein